MEYQSIESSFDENRFTMPVVGIFVLVEGENYTYIMEPEESQKGLLIVQSIIDINTQQNSTLNFDKSRIYRKLRQH
jgi:hypothetical protein